MKHLKCLDHLYSLREEIGALRLVKCHMAHERVIKADESMLPVISRSPENNYQRIGLCSPEVRAKRLGCSHTSARIKLADAIDELTSSGEEVTGLGQRLRGELGWLNNQIHLLDHRKGEAEKTLARMLEEAFRAGAGELKGEELMDAEYGVQELELAHDEYVERIGRLRDEILIEIDKLMEQSRATLRSRGTLDEGLRGTPNGRAFSAAAMDSLELLVAD
jgi:hypothetical protein